MNTKARLLQLPRREDARGSLTFGQYPDQLPFPPVRYFAIGDVPSGTPRGGHAHRLCQQVLVALHGGVEAVLIDAGGQDEVTLDSPSRGLHVPPLVWADLRRFTPGTVLLVLASHPYDEADYVRSMPEFRRLTGTR